MPEQIRSRIAVLLGVALVAAGVTTWLAPSAQALAKWSAPRNLFANEVSHIGVDLARDRPALLVRADAAGNAIAAWTEDVSNSCQTKWAARPFGGGWGVPRALAPATSCLNAGLALAMNSNGAAVAAWVQGADVYAAVRPAGGLFGTGEKVSSGAGFAADPAAAINAKGSIAVAWVEHSITIGQPDPLKARVRPAGGSFGAVELLTTTDAAAAPSLAVDPAGNVLALWALSHSTSLYTSDIYIDTAYRPAGATFPTTPTQTLDTWTYAAGGLADFAPDVALDANGRATAVWVQDTGTKRVVRSAAKIAGASQFGTIQTVNPSDTGNSRLPRVAVDPATDTAAAVWLQCGTSCTVRSASRPSGGGFGNLQTLSGALPTVGVFAPVVGFSSTGAALAAWSGAPDGTGPDRVAVARRPKGGAFGSATFVSGPAGTADENGPALGFDGHGNAVVVWAHVTGTPAALVRYADFLGSWYQPDGLIKKASATSYSGAKIYNTTGAHQIVAAKVRRGHSVTFDIKAVNRSSAIDRLAVKGAGAKTGFTVKYLAGMSGTTTITTSVLNGSYVLKLGPGAAKVFRLVVTAKAGAVVGTADYWPVTLTSVHDTTRKDVVKASVTIAG
jgi:hypothetical protein